MVIGGFLFILVFVVIGFGSLVLSIMTAVDSSKYPEWAFQQARTTKFVWQILPIILIFVCSVAGGVMGIIWYTSKRDEVARVANAAGPPPYFGAPPYPTPPPTWGQQASPTGWAPPPAPPSAPPSVPPSAPPTPEPPAESPQ
jgi:hypothetical protein